MTQVSGIQQALLEWRHRSPSFDEQEMVYGAICDMASRVERVWCGLCARSPLQAALQKVIPSCGPLQYWQIEALMASLKNPRAQRSLWVFVARRFATLLAQQILSVSTAVRVRGVASLMRSYLSRSERAYLDQHQESLRGLDKLQWAHDAVKAVDGTRAGPDPGWLEGLTELLTEVMHQHPASQLTARQLLQLLEVWEATLSRFQEDGADPSWSAAQRSLWQRWLPDLQVPVVTYAHNETGAGSEESLFSRFFRLLRELGRPQATSQEGKWWATLAFWSARHLEDVTPKERKEVLICFAHCEPLWRQCALALTKQSILHAWVGTLSPEEGAECMLHPSMLSAAGEAATRLPASGAHWESLVRLAARTGRLVQLREFLAAFCNAPIPHAVCSEILVEWSISWQTTTPHHEQSLSAADWVFWFEKSLRSSKAPGHAALCSVLLPHASSAPRVLQALHDLPHRVMLHWFQQAARAPKMSMEALQTAAALRKRAFSVFKESSKSSKELQQICKQVHALIESQVGVLQGRSHSPLAPGVLRALVNRNVGEAVFAVHELRQLRLELPNFSSRAQEIASVCQELLKTRQELWNEQFERCLFFLARATPETRRAWLEMLQPLPEGSQVAVHDLLQHWGVESPCPLPTIVAWAAKSGSINWLRTESDWLLDEIDSHLLPIDPVEAAWACQGLWQLQESLAGQADAATLAAVRKLGMRWLLALPAYEAGVHRTLGVDASLMRRLRQEWGKAMTLEHVPQLGPHSRWPAVLRQKKALETTGALTQGLLPGWREELARGWQQMCATLTEVRESHAWSPIALEAYQWAMARVVTFGSSAASLGLLWELPMPPGAHEEGLIGRLRELLRPKVKLEVAAWQRAWLASREQMQVDGSLFQCLAILNLAFRLDLRSLPPAMDEVEEQPFPEQELMRALECHAEEERPAARAAILRLKRVLVERHSIVALDERDRFAWTNRQNARLSRILKGLNRDAIVSVFWPHLQDALEGCATRWAEGLRRLEAKFHPYEKGVGAWSSEELVTQWMRSIRRDQGALKLAELLVGTGSVHSQNLILSRLPEFFGVSHKELKAIKRDRFVEQMPEIDHEDLENVLVSLCSPRVIVEEVAQRLAALPWLRDADEEPSLMVLIERLAPQQKDRLGQPLDREAQTAWIQSHAGWISENMMKPESYQPLALELCVAGGWLKKTLLI